MEEACLNGIEKLKTLPVKGRLGTLKSYIAPNILIPFRSTKKQN